MNNGSSGVTQGVRNRCRMPSAPRLLVAALGLLIAGGAAAAEGNRLSKRAQLRYEDVLTTRDGSRWRGRLVERGEVYRIQLADKSEVAVPQAEVASVTRELRPSFPHQGQWGARAALGGEAAISTGENAGIQYGGLAEVALTRNFGGSFEPEVVIVLSPLGPDDGVYGWQIALGARYYLSTNARAKPFTNTQLVFYGDHADLGLRTGPGILFDVSPNIGLGVSQGVTLMTQAEPAATGVGYHVLLTGQGRF